MGLTCIRKPKIVFDVFASRSSIIVEMRVASNVRELLEEYVPRVYRFALRLTNDPHAADDLTQETFLRAWRRRQVLRDPRTARVWLFRIAVNVWNDQLRRKRSLVAQAVALPIDQPDRGPGPERKVEDQESLRLALQSLQELPDRQRHALYLRACEGLSAAEIASVLDTSADSVKASLCVARKKLREQLRELFESLFLVL
jgi:RNA polymerase sigma-70 factor (ECF subfamily)